MFQRIVHFVSRKMSTKNNFTKRLWEDSKWIATISLGEPGYPPVWRTMWEAVKWKPGAFYQPEDTCVGDVLETANMHLHDVRFYWVVVKVEPDEIEVKICKSFLHAMVESERLTGQL